MRATWRCCNCKFRSILNGNQAFLVGNESRQRVQHRSLAGTGTTRDDCRNASGHCRGQHFGHLRPQGAHFDQLVQAQRFFRKFADRNERAVNGDRPHCYVDAGAVEKARVAKWLRFINAAADGRHDTVDDAQEMSFVAKLHVRGSN